MRLVQVVLAMGMALLLSGLVSFQGASLNYDPDECGYRPTGICCDNSAESSFCIDRDDDHCYAKIWVNYREWLANYAYIFIYGQAAGTVQNPGYGVKLVINNNDVADGAFHPSDHFSTSQYGWESFKVSYNYFDYNSWNYIRLDGFDSDYTTDILYVGIDTTTAQSGLADFQKSAWSNQGDQNPDPWNCEGNLMIRVYFSNEEILYNDFDTSREDYVGIDNNGLHDDLCGKSIQINTGDLDDIGMAQLQIWGYAWGTTDSGNRLMVTINNQDVISFNPYDIFKQNCWGWGYITFFASDFLIEGQANTFDFTDSSSYTHDNFGIGIDTTNDYDNSWWDWYDGQQAYGSYNHNPTQCTGELMVRLLLCNKDYPLDYTDQNYYKEFSGFGQEHFSTLATLDWDGISDLAGDFNSNGWQVNQNWLDGIQEGDIYSENYGDSSDFVCFATHGNSNTLALYNDNGQDSHSTTDNVAFCIVYYTSQAIMECDYSSGNGVDGFDCDTEWIWFYACSIFNSYGTDPFKAILCHGAHYVFGDTGTVYDSWLPDIEEDFIDMAIDNEYTVASSFVWAWTNNLHSNGCYYFHDINADDYLWGIDSGPNFDSYEHDDISYYHM